MFAQRLSSIALGFSVSLALTAVGPANAQSDYTSPPPAPGDVTTFSDQIERLTADNESIVYGSWDFIYAFTPDDNLFVTRIFVADLGDQTIAMTMQMDCGRGMFRHLISPRVYEGYGDSGVPMSDVAIDSWMYLNADGATGQAIMRTCEAAAQEGGTEWDWL